MSDFLIEEYKQAWEHYRHLENARSKFMNFFYAALFAVTTAVYVVFKDIREEEDSIAFSLILILLNLLNIFTTYIYLNVKKCGLALSHYENTIKTIRQSETGRIFTNTTLDIRKAKIMSSHWFSIQTTTQMILIFMMLIVNSIIVWFTLHFTCYNYVMATLSLITCLLVVSVQVIGIAIKK